MDNKVFLIFFHIVFFSLYVNAQYSRSYELEKYQSTANPEVFRARYDIENAFLYQIRHQTALTDWLLKKKGFSESFYHGIKEEKNILKLSVGSFKNNGEYIYYQGNERAETTVLAGGHINMLNSGSLIGQASYQRKRIHNMLYNYAVYPQYYYPYLVGDSLFSGVADQEIYNIKGAYSFSKGKWNYGLDVVYEGVAQSRSYNPRYSNYSYWLRLGVSGSLFSGNNVIGARIYPEINSQSISVSTLFNSEKFFQFYGLGQWNRRESKGALQYGRTQQIRGIGGELMYIHNGTWKLMTTLSYNYRSLLTEETSLKNLFLSSTHNFRQAINISRYFSGSSLHFQFATQKRIRKGEENVYQNILQDSIQNLYDYIRIGSNQLYTSSYYDGGLRAKYILNLSTSNYIHLLAGLNYSSFEEMYKLPYSRIKYNNLTPSFIVGYQHFREKHSVECNLQTSLKKNLAHNYILSKENNSIIEYLVLTPYRIHTENAFLLGGQAIYSYSLSTSSEIGVNLFFYYLNSEYRKNHQFGIELFYMF